ncbi:MAG: AMP-binding protein [Spirochaetes bacterium]|nr:AMP-binding protein [Spirochaetota bacterium]
MSDVYSTKPWLRHYDDDVPPTLDYPSMSYAAYLREAFDRVPHRISLYYMGKGITYRELDDLSNRFANFLVNNGCGPGDFVAVNLPNIPACFISLVGIQKAGCVYQGVSPLLTPEELEYQLNDSGARILVTLDLLFEKFKEPLKKTAVRHVVVTSIADYMPSIKRTAGLLLKKIPVGKTSAIQGIEVSRFRELLKGMPHDPVLVAVDPGSPCVMVYTGGTTGKPKGALLSHNNLVRHMIQNNAWYNFDKWHETTLCPYPMFHMAGCFISMGHLSIGSSYILIPNPRDLQYTISLIKSHKPTSILAVPTIYIELMKLKEFRSLDLTGVRYFLSGSAPFPAESIKQFETLIGGRIIETYGLTETTTCVAAPPVRGKRKSGSVGVPISDTEVRIVDPETSEPVPPGEPGEILARGPQVFGGYHRQPEETSHALSDGWFRTGDIGTMDDEGYLFIVDRIKDMVNVSGFKVFTRMVDEFLLEHPDVAMAATVGLPDVKRPGSEIVASAIVLKPGREKSETMKTSIISFLESKLAPYKIPKRIEFMDQLPLSNVGKILKKDLRTILAGDAAQRAGTG